MCNTVDCDQFAGEGVMILDHTVTVKAPVDRVWDFMMDIPAVSRCVPGVEELQQLDANTYQGTLNARVGPIGVRLQGKVTVTERDHENLLSRLDVTAAEKRIASTVNASATMSLVPKGGAETELRIRTDASIVGKLGEFGQTVIRRKADQVVAEFAGNVGKALADG
jgi:carbon monoxide dehydrogenase subunit G